LIPRKEILLPEGFFPKIKADPFPKKREETSVSDPSGRLLLRFAEDIIFLKIGQKP